MPINPTAENVFGTLGTVCWTVQLVPQLWKSYRAKDTTGLSDVLLLIWGLSSATFLGPYSIVKNLNIPLIVQPQLFSALALLSWAQCQYYSGRRSLRVTVILYISICAIIGAFEIGMVYAIRPSYSRGESSGNAGVEAFGILSAVGTALGLIPQYYEIYKRKEVIGISVLFMIVDLMGGVFNDLSLVFKAGEFQVLAAITYSLVVVMDGVVIIAAWILNPRARRRRQRSAEAELETREPTSPSAFSNVSSVTMAATETASTIAPSTPTSAKESDYHHDYYHATFA